MIGIVSKVVRELPSLPRELAVRYARVPGVYALVRQERCSGCSACVRKGFCRFGAISMTEERKAHVDERRCRGCGRCTHLCSRDAFALEIRPPRLVTKTLRRIDNELTELMK
ncbi:MAG: hypothetical protein GX307_00185 [Euryarchaeota archaeon]|nr:hypothetical protein [Euryarchaeota archaeon]